MAADGVAPKTTALVSHSGVGNKDTHWDRHLDLGRKGAVVRKRGVGFWGLRFKNLGEHADWNCASPRRLI